MPETAAAAAAATADVDTVSREWLQARLRTAAADVIVLDCRNSADYAEGHIRLAVNFSIPSIMLRRLAAGKIDLTSTIKCAALKERIAGAYAESVFVLYTAGEAAPAPADASNGRGGAAEQTSAAMMQLGGVGGSSSASSDASIINVLHRRLKQDGCRVYLLEDGFTSFRNAFPEWCEDESSNAHARASMPGGATGPATEQLMGLRSLRISAPPPPPLLHHSDSACSSSADSSSDCESASAQQRHPHSQRHHPDAHASASSGGAHSQRPPGPGAPVEILPGLYLGNAAHSGDAHALQRHNIQFVLNVTPDLPNVFADAGAGIEYLQIPITDHWSQDLAGYFPVAIKFIEDARSSGCSVLVHCLAGVSRSVTVTLAYLMHARALCLNDAFSLVRQRKPDVSPNFHFMQQLHSFEGQLQQQRNAAAGAGGGGPSRTPLSAVSAASAASASMHSQASLESNASTASSSCYLTPDCMSSAAATPDFMMGGGGESSGGVRFGRPSKYSCACVEVECQCYGSMQQHQQHHNQQQQQQHAVPTSATSASMAASVLDRNHRMMGGAGGAGGSGSGSAGVGVSPDSGIEFDRWTPAGSLDGQPK